VGAKVFLSNVPIVDLTTQWFADRHVFCTGRIPLGGPQRAVQAESTHSDTKREHFGTCNNFEERQTGSFRLGTESGYSKINAINSAAEAASLILSVGETARCPRESLRRL
jgi:hypothetical protein